MPANTTRTKSPPLTRFEKLLQREIEPCEHPTCCCEPEPRWLRFDQRDDTPSEWDAIDRPPADEL